MVAAAALPLLAAPENVSASALLLRGRYDLAAGSSPVTMGIRSSRSSSARRSASRRRSRRWRSASWSRRWSPGRQGARAPPLPARRADADRSDRREIVSFVVQSSIATGRHLAARGLTPVLLGVVAGTTQVGYYRVALAPQSGFSAASARFASCSSPSRPATGSTAARRPCSAA